MCMLVLHGMLYKACTLNIEMLHSHDGWWYCLLKIVLAKYVQIDFISMQSLEIKLFHFVSYCALF